MSKQKTAGGGNYFLEHGEKIVVIAAGGIAFLLLVFSLFWPGSGFFSDSPDEKAEALQKKTKGVRASMQSAKPGPTDLPPEDFRGRVARLDKELVNADNFQMASLRSDSSDSQVGRRVPKIFPIEEAAVAVARVQIKTYDLYLKDGVLYISTLKGEKANKGPMGSGRFGSAPPMGAMGPGRGPRGSSNIGPKGGLTEADQKKDREVIGVRVDEYEKKGGGDPVIVIRPQRLAVIVASFPFKRQVEEFRSKLSLRSADAVFTETSLDKPNPKAKVGSAAFRFVGVRVQRRELDGNGKPVGKWAKIDLANSYREFIRSAGREFEKDTGEYTQLSFPGLVMPKLKQFRPEDFGFPAVGGSMYGSPGPGGRGGRMAPPPMPMPMGGTGEEGADAKNFDKTPSQYPPVEGDLRLLARSLEELKTKKGPVAGPKLFNDDEFNPFGANQGNEAKEDMDMGMGKDKDPMDPANAKPQELPEHCLVRIIDVNVEPGKTYEYQLQVVMGNPNFDRPDVASPLYAEKKYLESEWSTVPIKVAVAPELVYYAVDQALVDGARKRGSKSLDPKTDTKLRTKKSTYIAMQAHRWLVDFNLAGGDTKMVVGEWAVAERMAVARGMYLGKEEYVKLPVWRPQQQSYVLPDLTRRRKGERVMKVPFEYDEKLTRKAVAPQAILVDFEQRGERGYERIVKEGAEGAPDVRRMVTDDAAGQALIMSPNGKLLLREGALDLNDQERSQRLEDFRKRIKEVENKGKSDDFGGPKKGS